MADLSARQKNLVEEACAHPYLSYISTTIALILIFAGISCSILALHTALVEIAQGIDPKVALKYTHAFIYLGVMLMLSGGGVLSLALTRIIIHCRHVWLHSDH